MHLLYALGAPDDVQLNALARFRLAIKIVLRTILYTAVAIDRLRPAPETINIYCCY